MASTVLSTLPTAQGLLNFDDASVSFEPDLAFLSTTSALGLLGAFSPSLADLVADFAETVDDISGQVLITAGVFDADLLLADGTNLIGVFDAPATLEELASLAAITNGTVTLADGILAGTLTTGDETLVIEDLDLASLAGTAVLEAINAIDATVPFTNGAFSFEAGSALGPISGTIDVAGGDLNVDLLTPLGRLIADIDFSDEAVFPFTVPVPVLGTVSGVVDFNAGNIVAPLGPLGNATVPISTINGTLTLADGLASFAAEIPLAAGLPFIGNTTIPVTTEIELGPLASEYVADLIQDLTGEATITDGVIEASLDSPLGLFETTFDVVAFTNQGADFFAGVDGTLDIGEGFLTASLTTPLGPVDQTFDLVEIAGLLDVPLGDLIAG